MSLPDNYTQKTKSLTAFFDSIQDAHAPERFSYKFLEGLGFASTADRLFIGVLKSLGFLNSDSEPTELYFKYLDKDESQYVLANAIRETYSDLFAVNKNAHQMSSAEVKNKLTTLYAGKKTPRVVALIANTFSALCEMADFTHQSPLKDKSSADQDSKIMKVDQQDDSLNNSDSSSLKINGLQYHINIVLPDSRDEKVFDAIFKSLRTHLG